MEEDLENDGRGDREERSADDDPSVDLDVQQEREPALHDGAAASFLGTHRPRMLVGELNAMGACARRIGTVAHSRRNAFWRTTYRDPA